MKLGLGLYRHMLNRENYRFARQCGCTHIVAHLVDYFNVCGEATGRHNQPVGDTGGWGYAGDPDKLWTAEEMGALKRGMADEGLILEAIENFDPAFWYDILLDGPKKRQQIEGVKTILRNVGAAGIPIFGYNFSIAGVGGRVERPWARGHAISVGMEREEQTPLPAGMVWNMIYDADALAGGGVQASATHEQLWERMEYFLGEVLPVAEQAGVTLALHPDDPPTPTLRGQPRLVYQPRYYDRLLALNPSRSNGMEFCVGTLAEMTEGDIYDVVDHFSRTGRIGYVHLRNVRGKSPQYRETFIDDGDVDMRRVLSILRANGFDGVLIPDHTPQLSCDAPWHAGMAYALGYMNACLKELQPAP